MDSYDNTPALWRQVYIYVHVLSALNLLHIGCIFLYTCTLATCKRAKCTERGIHIVFMYICKKEYIYIYICVYVYICRIYMFICTDARMYICAYMHVDIYVPPAQYDVDIICMPYDFIVCVYIQYSYICV